ncbi:MAG TPA: CoA transferase, partial [Gammaproteobacteria bacterium]|nr:CoA transferase [Gammaproteobacteria bacterium]
MQDPEKNLRWWFQNRGKQSVTLDLDKESDQILLRQLAEGVDAILESFPVGYLDERDLGFKVLSLINPRLVFTSITPFGQTGPYAKHQANDLTLSALSGAMYLTGDNDRAPVRISVP